MGGVQLPMVKLTDMTNWDIYLLAHTVANKDVLSNWFPVDKFNAELKAKNILHLKNRLGLPERYQPGTMRAGASASRQIEIDLLPFLVKKQVQVLSGEAIVVDFFYINDFYTDVSIAPEIISQQELGQRIRHPLRKATSEYPWAVITQKGLSIQPSTTTEVYVSWYRNPQEPNMVTTVDSDGIMTYDQLNSTELEWSDTNKLAVLHMILQDAGIITSMPDLEQLAQKLTETGM